MDTDMGNSGGKLTDEEKAKLQEKIESSHRESTRSQKTLTSGMKLVLLMLLDGFIWLFAIVRYYSSRSAGLPLDALFLLTILITVGGIIYIRASSKEE